MARHYVGVLEQIVADKDKAVGSLDVLASEERLQVLEGWNQTAYEIAAGDAAGVVSRAG